VLTTDRVYAPAGSAVPEPESARQD